MALNQAQIDYFNKLEAMKTARIPFNQQEINDYNAFLPHIQQMMNAQQQQQQNMYPPQQQNNGMFMQQQQGMYPPQQQQQDPMYAANAGGGIFNSTVPTGTPQGTDVKHSGKNFGALDYVEDMINKQYPKQPAQQAAQPKKKEIVAKTPLDGNEFLFLTTPDLKCVRVIVSEDGTFKNKIEKKTDEEKEKTMNYLEHASVYDTTNVISGKIVEGKIDHKLNLLVDRLEIVDSVKEMFNRMDFIVHDNKDGMFENTAMEVMIIDTFMVNRVNNDPTETFYYKTVMNSDNLKEVADFIAKHKHSKNSLLSKAFKSIDGSITKLVNNYFRSMIGARTKVDSFSDDYMSLLHTIEHFTDVREASLHKALLSDLYTVLKENATALSSLEIEDTLNSKKVGKLLYGEKLTLINTRNLDVKYELTDVSRGTVKYIKDDLTPILNSLINTVLTAQELVNNIIILTTDDGDIFRLVKSKLTNSYTIEKI